MGVNWFFLDDKIQRPQHHFCGVIPGTVQGRPNTVEYSSCSLLSQDPTNPVSRRHRFMQTTEATDQLLDKMVQRRLHQELARTGRVRIDELDESVAGSSAQHTYAEEASIKSMGSITEHPSETTEQLLGIRSVGVQDGIRKPIPPDRPKDNIHKEGYENAAVRPSRPETPVIVWRPSTTVRLARNVPPELLESSSSSPTSAHHFSKHDELIGPETLTPVRLLRPTGTANSGTHSGGRSLREALSHNHSKDKNQTLAEVHRFRNRIRTKPLRPLSQGPPVKDKAPKQKLRYGAWYIDPKKWTVGMKDFDQGPEDLFHQGPRSAEMAALDQKIAKITCQLPDLLIAQEFKQYATEKGARIPEYLKQKVQT